MEDRDWLVGIDMSDFGIGDATVISRAAKSGRAPRPRGVVDRKVEIRDGVEYLVEVHAPESAPRRRRGKGQVGKYASPKPQSVVAKGSSFGTWTGSDIDRALVNSVLRHTKRAMKFAEANGSLVNAPWAVIGITALKRAVQAVRDHEAENCPVWEQAHVLDDWDEELRRIMEGSDA